MRRDTEKASRVRAQEFGAATVVVGGLWAMSVSVVGGCAMMRATWAGELASTKKSSKRVTWLLEMVLDVKLSAVGAGIALSKNSMLCLLLVYVKPSRRLASWIPYTLTIRKSSWSRSGREIVNVMESVSQGTENYETWVMCYTKRSGLCLIFFDLCMPCCTVLAKQVVHRVQHVTLRTCVALWAEHLFPLECALGITIIDIHLGHPIFIAINCTRWISCSCKVICRNVYSFDSSLNYFQSGAAQRSNPFHPPRTEFPFGFYKKNKLSSNTMHLRPSCAVFQCWESWSWSGL